MRKIIVVALSACAILVAQVAGAADKAKAHQSKVNLAKAPQGRGNPAKQGEFFDSLKSKILDCKSTHAVEEETLRMELRTAFMNKRTDNMFKGKDEALDYLGAVDRLKVEEEVISKQEAKGFQYKKCIDDAKTTTAQGGAKEFVDTFSAAQKSQAKALLAQWFTAMDAIEKDNFNQELSKYDSLVNNLKIEAMTN